MADTRAWLFYHVQNEKGEESKHPNACKLKAAAGGRVTLEDVQASFPLTGSGSFHFRFQMATPDKQITFLDLVNPADIVPMVGGNVVAKVLRIDTAKCVARMADGLRLRPGVVGTQGVRGQPSLAREATSSPPAGAAARPAPRPPAAEAARGVTRNSSAPSPPASSSSSSSTAAAAAPAGSPSASSPSSVGAKPVRSLANLNTDVVVPDVVDDDLADKSDYVKAKVMERRNELRKAQAERIAEVDSLEKSAAAEQDQRDSLKAKYGAGLTEWAQEHGKTKNIRVLIATLPSVLWEGAKWEPVPMAKLVIPSKIKFYFMRAITLVHPDKQNLMEAPQKFIATQIFHALETAYRVFQDTEMGGA